MTREELIFILFITYILGYLTPLMWQLYDLEKRISKIGEIDVDNRQSKRVDEPKT